MSLVRDSSFQPNRIFFVYFYSSVVDVSEWWNLLNSEGRKVQTHEFTSSTKAKEIILCLGSLTDFSY